MSAVFDFSPTGYREFAVNSLRWVEGDQNYCHVVANQPIQDVVALSVIDAQIPFTFYNVDKYHNRMWMRERVVSDPAPSGSYNIVTIEPGNYSSQTIGPAIITAIAAAGFTGTYTVTYNATTGKLVIASSTGYFDLLFSDNKNDYLCLKPIGFDPYTQTNYINVTSVTTPHVISLSGPSCILLRGTMGLGTSDTSVICDDGELNNIGNVVAQIPVNCSPGNTITYLNYATRGGMFAGSTSTFRDAWFWLTNGDDDMPIDLNGECFTFRLGLLVRNDNAQGIDQRGYGPSSVFSGPRGNIRFSR